MKQTLQTLAIFLVLSSTLALASSFALNAALYHFPGTEQQL
ncbi:MAG: hypothetical protein WA173_08000 [Pseudomonas sp.]